MEFEINKYLTQNRKVEKKERKRKTKKEKEKGKGNVATCTPRKKHVNLLAMLAIWAWKNY